MSFQLDEARLIESAKSVEIVANRVLEGVHISKRGGEGLEFHSANPYSPGEDSRRIDWKRYAASERLYVKKFDREEKVGWAFLVDGSSSMKYGSKLEMASFLTGIFCFLAKTWGDYFLLSPDIERDLGMAMERLSAGQAHLQPSEFSGFDSGSKCKLLVFSDFFYDSAALSSVLSAQNFEEVHLFQILDPREQEFPFHEVIEFRDLENPQKLVLDSRVVKKKYLEELGKIQEDVRKNATSFQIVATNETNPEEVILNFFEKL